MHFKKQRSVEIPRDRSRMDCLFTFLLNNLIPKLKIEKCTSYTRSCQQVQFLGRSVLADVVITDTKQTNVLQIMETKTVNNQFGGLLKSDS